MPAKRKISGGSTRGGAKKSKADESDGGGLKCKVDPHQADIGDFTPCVEMFRQWLCPDLL